MSVSGGTFGNLDNFRSTALSGPDATRKFGTASGSMRREARALRRQGYGREAAAMAGQASVARLQEREGPRSFEGKRDLEDLNEQTQADENRVKGLQMKVYEQDLNDRLSRKNVIGSGVAVPASSDAEDENTPAKTPTATTATPPTAEYVTPWNRPKTHSFKNPKNVFGVNSYTKK